MPAPADEELRALAATVRRLRRERRLTQEAAGLNGGLGRKYFGQLERRQQTPSYGTLPRVARGLEMSLADLLRVAADDLEKAGA